MLRSLLPAGQVVGISTMKAIAADGISFAIPIDTAKEVLQQLQEHGRVLRPYCGIRMLQLTEALLPQLRAQDPAFPPITRGILVSEVSPGPASPPPPPFPTLSRRRRVSGPCLYILSTARGLGSLDTCLILPPCLRRHMPLHGHHAADPLQQMHAAA